MKTLLLVVSFFLLEISIVQAQTEFFGGKTIRIVTGYPAGDVNDMWPRLIAQHMTKYIPGNPNIIIQNMPGASSMIAANYVFSVAKPDGLTLGWIAPTLYFDQLVGRKEMHTIGASTALSVPPRRANITFICAPTVRTKRSKISAMRANRRNAVPAAPPEPVSIFPGYWKKPWGRNLPSFLAIKAAAPSILRWRRARSTVEP